jgi:membrane protease YdiL (CAAX protease family)
MTAWAAAGWVFAMTAVFFTLWQVFASVRDSAKEDEITGFGCQAIAYLLGLFGIIRFYGPESSIRQFIAMRRTSWVFYPIAILLGFAATFAADALLTAILHRFPMPGDDNLSSAFNGISRLKQFLIALEVAFAGPLIEEIVFRGAIFGPLKKAYPRHLVIIVTAVLFALVHIVWQRFLPLVLLAVCLGYLRSWSGSMLPTFLFHASFNALAVAATYYQYRAGKPIEIPDRLEIPVVVGSVVSVVLLMALAWLVAKRSEAAANARLADDET